jgi:steroid delta-isomerase-like uncharacterized protein
MRTTHVAAIAVILVVLSFTGCTPKEAKKDLIMDIVHAKFDAMNRHDADSLALLYSDSATIESPNWEGVIIGSGQVHDTYARYFKSSPDLKYTITHVVEGTNGVTVEYTSEGTLENNEPGVPPFMRGKHYVLKNIVRMDIQNNKIVNEATYFDQVSFLKQMGFFNAEKK